MFQQPTYKSGFSAVKTEDLLTEPGVDQLIAMHKYMRPAGSKGEEEFIEAFILPLGGWEDKYGNTWVQVGDRPNILWSSHTDTVHRESGRQKLLAGDGKLMADTSSCLGADDSAGVWLMIEMIKARKEGLYIFHREEEVGGHGSTFIARHHADLLAGIDCAIALDRKGYDSVITHQGARCCSDEFAKSLAGILGGVYAPDSTGLFTDTANYTGIIGECSNLSIGYHQAHGPAEWLDLGFVIELRDKLVAADFSSLVFKRKAGEEDPDYEGRWFGGYGYGGTTSKHTAFRDGSSFEDLLEYVKANPSVVAGWLEKEFTHVDDIDDFFYSLDEDEYEKIVDAHEYKDGDEENERWN